MSKLPPLSGKEIIKALSKMGVQPIRQKGIHVFLAKETEKGKHGIVVPNHKEIDIGTPIEIMRQAGLKRYEFLELL